MGSPVTSKDRCTAANGYVVSTILERVKQVARRRSHSLPYHVNPPEGEKTRVEGEGCVYLSSCGFRATGWLRATMSELI